MQSISAIFSPIRTIVGWSLRPLFCFLVLSRYSPEMHFRFLSFTAIPGSDGICPLRAIPSTITALLRLRAAFAATDLCLHCSHYRLRLLFHSNTTGTAVACISFLSLSLLCVYRYVCVCVETCSVRVAMMYVVCCVAFSRSLRSMKA